MQGNVQRHWSEIVILLGPDECQLGELLLDLSKLPGHSSNEDRLQMCKEGIISWEKIATTALNALQQLS